MTTTPPFMAVTTRNKLIDHLIAFHGACSGDISAWTLRDLRDLHSDDHYQRSFRPGRIVGHSHFGRPDSVAWSANG